MDNDLSGYGKPVSNDVVKVVTDYDAMKRAELPDDVLAQMEEEAKAIWDSIVLECSQTDNNHTL
jgi:hypothetical protein